MGGAYLAGSHARVGRRGWYTAPRSFEVTILAVYIGVSVTVAGAALLVCWIGAKIEASVHGDH